MVLHRPGDLDTLIKPNDPEQVAEKDLARLDRGNWKPEGSDERTRQG